MNKIIIINILKELIIKYQNNELDETTYNQILTNFEFCSLTNNLSSYKETELLSLLFKTVPYYKIFTFLSEFINHLKSISTNSNSKLMTSLIEGLICELIANLEKRITTEANTHIYKLCQIFYISCELDYEMAIKILEKNLIVPEVLVSLDVASNANYKQEVLESFSKEDENIREKVSQKNFNRSSAIERKLTTLLVKFFNQETLDNFEEKLTSILAQYKEENPDETDLIHDTIIGQFQIVKKNVSKKWQDIINNTTSDPNQIDIFSLTKNKA